MRNSAAANGLIGPITHNMQAQRKEINAIDQWEAETADFSEIFDLH